MQAVSDVLAATAQGRGQSVTEFKFLEASFGALDARKVARLVASTVDLTFVIDSSGRIQQAVSLDPRLSRAARDHWVGQMWTDTATVESRPKIKELLAEANPETPTRWREINQVAAGEECPLRFSAVKFDDDGLIVVMGYDLQPVAQRLCPGVTQALDWLGAQGLKGRMTGSGSAVFARLAEGSMPTGSPPSGHLQVCSNLEVHPLVGWAASDKSSVGG